MEDKIHWWKFRALFDALPDTCQFRKVVGYRAIEINQNMTDSQKKFYKEMKKIYALEDKRTLEEKEADFANALFGWFMILLILYIKEMILFWFAQNVEVTTQELSW